MKREYTKPDILFESFSLSTSIAGDCAVKTNTPAEGKCGVPSTGLGIIFTTALTSVCTFGVVDDGTFVVPGSNDRVCYHTPTPVNNLFNS